MESLVARVFEALNSTHFPITHEISLHQKMEDVFKSYNIPFEREVFLSKSDKVDFLIESSIALEVKIKGRAMSIYRQCERYCTHDSVEGIILASSKPMGFPKEICGKPAYFFNLTSNALM
tara:strand:+ start:22349 stop:22708 length:360 start_codon:yes stop_codon:yes gene_type:complete